MFNSKKLRSAMSEKGLTAAKLAEISGVSKVSISQYLSEKNTPSKKNIAKLEEILCADLSDLSNPEPQKNNLNKAILNAKQASEKYGIPAQKLRQIAKTARFSWAVAVKGVGEQFVYTFTDRGLKNWIDGKAPA
jgi:transcriptional regulator with XRE-family HTH domain